MAKRERLHLTLVTPERMIVDEDVESVVIPAHDGELGILKNRAPLMCELGVGTLRFRKGGKEQSVVIDAGFAQVLDNTVTVLTPDAHFEAQVTDAMISAAESAARDIRGAGEDAVARKARFTRKARIMRHILSRTRG